MAIFRGTGGSGNSTDDSIVDAVTEQAGIATTKASEAATSATNAASSASAASSSATTAATKATEATTAKTDAETAETNAQTAQSAAETARDQAQTSATSAATSANTANSAAVQTVAGSNTQVVGVYNNIGSVNTVAGDITNVNTVAGISSDVTTVAADASDIGTVSSNIGNVNNVGNNISNVNSVAGNASNINTVASDGTDIGTVAGNISNVNTVAGISSNVTTVAGLETKMDTVIADASDIGTVAGNINDVSTVAGISSDVTSVADNSSNINSVASNMTAVQGASTNATNAATSASNASDSASAASTSASTAATKATEAAASAALITNLTAATGPAGTSANYNSTTGVLTVPRGDTGATGATGATGPQGNNGSLTVDTVSGDLSFADNGKAKFGAGNDLQIFHNGSDSYINDTGTGNLNIKASNNLYLMSGSSELYAKFTTDGAATLYHNNAAKLATTSTGVDVTGSISVGGTTVIDNNRRILAADGAANVPYYTFSGDTNTGLFNPSADNLGFSTGGTERMRLTSDGKLGIGTSAPSATLDVQSSSGATFFMDDTNGRSLKFRTANSGSQNANISSYSGLNLGGSDNANHVLIDSNGKVGIGTQAPAGLCHIHNSSAGEQFITSSNSALRFVSTGGANYIQSGTATSSSSAADLIFTNVGGTGETMRIDSSGTLLVGKTASSLSTDGVELGTRVESTTDGSYALRLNRKNSDGQIAQFRKDGSTVGSIGTGNSGNLWIGSGDTGINFNKDVNAVYPINADTGGSSNGAIDLGLAAFRYKDLYMSGTANVGGLTLGSNDRIQGTGILFVGGSAATAFEVGSGSEKMRLTSTGLGIGTTSPARTLDVNGGGIVRGFLTLYGTGTNNALFLNNTSHEWAAYTDASNNFVIADWNVAQPRLTIDTSGQVGIGTTAPDRPLEVASTSSIGLRLEHTDGGGSYIESGDTSGSVMFGNSAGSFLVFTGGNATYGSESEAMRIDSSGNLLVGTTDSSPNNNSNQNSDANGIALKSNGVIQVAKYNEAPIVANRTGSDGNIIEMRKDGSSTLIGSIGTFHDELFIGTGQTTLRFFDGSDAVLPRGTGGVQRDGAISLGLGSNRFDDVYATNGTIQTSDRNEKQDIAELSEAEQRVAVAAKGLLRKFRWKSAVEEKGDEARTHFGIIAQDLQDAFTAEGLDAGDYAMFINTTWTDEETGEERSRMGVRYSELLAFIISAI